jgi:hypothetical protein
MRLVTSLLTRPKSKLPAKLCVLSLLLSAHAAEARGVKELAHGAAIGAGIGVLIDGSGGVLSGATAGLLVAAISRRGNSNNQK